jgi:hypothetical protein
MAAAHPFGAFVGYRLTRIGCVRQIKVKMQVKWLQLQHTPLNTFLRTVDCAHDTVQNETLFSILVSMN